MSSGAAALFIDGDYLLRSIVVTYHRKQQQQGTTLSELLQLKATTTAVAPAPNVLGDADIPRANTLEESLVARLAAAVFGKETPEAFQLRLCFVTEDGLRRAALSMSSAGADLEAGKQRLLTALKVSKLQCIVVPSWYSSTQQEEESRRSTVDAAIAVRAVALALRNAKLEAFVFFIEAGLYATLFQFLTDEGKQVFVGKFVRGSERGGVDKAEELNASEWAAYVARPVIAVPRFLLSSLLPNVTESLPPVISSAVAVESTASVPQLPPPLPGRDNPFDDFFSSVTTVAGAPAHPQPASSSSAAVVTAGTSHTDLVEQLRLLAGGAASAPQHLQGQGGQPHSAGQLTECSGPSQIQPLAEAQRSSQEALSVVASSDTPSTGAAESAQPQPQNIGGSSATRRSLALEPEPSVVTPLPPACSMHYDRTYHRHYYMVPDGKGGSKCQWEHPLGQAEQYLVEKQVHEWYEAQKAKKMSLPASAASGGGGRPQDAVAPSLSSTVPVQAGAEVAFPTSQRASVVPVARETVSTLAVRPPVLPTTADPPLPEGWVQRYDNMRLVYVHTASGAQSLERPSATTIAAPQRSAPPVPAAASLPTVSSCWVARWDASSGRTFYANPATKETAWTLPPGAVLIDGPQATPTPTVSPGNLNAVVPASGPVLVRGTGQQPVAAAASFAASSIQQQPSTPQVATVPQPRLPPGWEMRVDASSGKPFYIDHNTKKTTWTAPPMF